MDTKPYVLVVEDEQLPREVLTRWLKSWGYEVAAVESADDALAVMTAAPAPIVITDIKMPVHNGLWLLEQLRARWPETVVIIESGSDNPETIQAAQQGGAVDFLPKPYGREMLYQALLRATSRIPPTR